MSGLFRYDFYPKDWFLDTRDLSQSAKGVYVDLFSAMYARGGPLPNNERELCRLTGCATVRSLRPLLLELIKKGKIKLVDGHLVNNRTMEEIAKANAKMADGAKGGKTRTGRVPAEYDGNTTGTQAETEGSFVEKQGDNPKLSSSSSPSSSLSNESGRPSAPQGGKNQPPRNGGSPDPVKAIFDTGVTLLTGNGVPEKQARSLVGKWRSQVGDEKLAGILVGAGRTTEPVAYVTKAVNNAARPGCETFI